MGISASVRRAAPAVLVAAFAAACSDDTPTAPPGAPPVAEVVFEPDTTSLLRGEEQALDPVIRDEAGEALEDREIGWTSSDPAVVSVTAEGVARGENEGTARITATSEGVSGTLDVTVREAPEFEVTAVEPDTLEGGAPARIRGRGLAEESLVVRIAGMDAEVTAAADTLAEVTVPALCHPAGDVEVEASILAGRLSRTLAHPTDPGSPLEMAPGEFRLVTDPQDFCLNFEGGAGEERYAFGLQSVSAAAASLTPVRVTAVASGAGTVADRLRPAPDPRGAGAGSPLHRTQALDPASSGDRWTRHHRAEATVRQQDRALVRWLSSGTTLPDGIPGRPATDPVAPDEVGVARSMGSVGADVGAGDTVEVRIPDIDSDDICREFRPVTAVVREVGERSVWVEDVDNGGDEGFRESDFVSLARSFDEDVHPALVEHFGEPTDIDDNGRIVVVVSRVLNDFEDPILGFVTAVDFFPRTANDGLSCASSDFGEYFYTRTPDADFDRQTALDDFPRLAAHETTHVIQIGRRIEAGAPDLQEVWELEGGAVLGEEVAGHRATGREARRNLGVDVIFNDGEEAVGETNWYLNGFADLFRYFGLRQRGDDGLDRVANAPEECSWLARNVQEEHGAPCEMFRREPYGVAWSFLRWVADHFHAELPDGEASFHRGLIDAGTRGFRSVEDLTGESRETLLAQWAASLYADGRLPGGAEPRLTFPSWDLGEFERRLVEEVQLQPRERTFSDFVDEVQVRAASTAYFVIEGSDRPATSVRARSLDEDHLPRAMQLWVLRIR